MDIILFEKSFNINFNTCVQMKQNMYVQKTVEIRKSLNIRLYNKRKKISFFMAYSTLKLDNRTYPIYKVTMILKTNKTQIITMACIKDVNILPFYVQGF